MSSDLKRQNADDLATKSDDYSVPVKKTRSNTTNSVNGSAENRRRKNSSTRSVTMHTFICLLQSIYSNGTIVLKDSKIQIVLDCKLADYIERFCNNPNTSPGLQEIAEKTLRVDDKAPEVPDAAKGVELERPEDSASEHGNDEENENHINSNIEETCDATVGDENDAKIDNNITEGSNINICNAESEKMNKYNFIINELYIEMEQQNVNFLFPKEMLKFFLATYHKFIFANDFKDTSAIVVKNDRRSSNSSNSIGKHATVLTNGSILYEYGKGFESFVGNMSRCETGDLNALKFILSESIMISPKIYKFYKKWERATNVILPKYTIEESCKFHENYVQIMIQNSRTMLVLLTRNVAMTYDGHQFVPPTINIEREFSTSMRHKSNLKNSECIVIEILFSSSKTKVLDLVWHSHMEVLPRNYMKRIEIIQTIFPNIPVVSSQINTQTVPEEISYIQKPLNGFGESFVHYRYNLIAAAVGIENKSVVLAFIGDNGAAQLECKLRLSILGPTSYMLAVRSYQSTDNVTKTPTIRYKGMTYDLVGTVDSSVRLFKEALAVEIKDGNKLGAVSQKQISHVNEYKAPVGRKETTSGMNDMFSQVISNPSLTRSFFEQFAESKHEIPPEVRDLLLSICKQPTIVTDFEM